MLPHVFHRITLNGHTETHYKDKRSSYQYQLDGFVAAVRGDVSTDAQRYCTTNSIGSMRVIDATYEAAGLPLRGVKPE